MSEDLAIVRSREHAAIFARLLEGTATELEETGHDLRRTPSVDEALVRHALTGDLLEDKLGIIQELLERVRKRAARLSRSLRRKSRRGLAALRNAWEALLDALNAFTGSLIAAMSGTGMDVTLLEAAQETKQFGRALLKSSR